MSGDCAASVLSTPSFQGATIFVIACTGQLWHLYQRNESGRLVLIRHDSLPAYTTDACLKVIAGFGHTLFTVRIIGSK